MSQIPTENEDNRFVAASDFVQLDQPDEMSTDQQEQQQFGLHQSTSDCTMNTGNTTRNYDNDLKEHQKLMIANLEAKNQTLQAKVENLELKAEIRALKEEAEQKANYQALRAELMKDFKDEFAKMISTQNEQNQQQIEQLKAKKRKLDEKMNNVELQSKGTTENGLEEIIQQKMAAFRKGMGENGNQAIGNNMKLDYIWDQLIIKSKIFAKPKGIVWDGLKTTAIIYGLKATSSDRHGTHVFATEGYAISGEHCRKDNFLFPRTIVFYYEVTITDCFKADFSVGFTDGNIPAGIHVGGSKNSYGIANNHSCWLSGKKHEMEVESPYEDDSLGMDVSVIGCGILLNSENQLAVFFTLNGILLVKQTPISPTVDRLYPTVYMHRTSAQANFGDNLVANPFKFDIDKCPGLVF